MRNSNIFFLSVESIKETFGHTFVSFTKNLKRFGLQICSSLTVGLLLHQRRLHHKEKKRVCPLFPMVEKNLCLMTKKLMKVIN